MTEEGTWGQKHMPPCCFRDSQVPNNVQGFYSALSETSSVYSHKENLHVWGHIIKIVK